MENKSLLRRVLKAIATIFGIYVNFDKGHGSDTGRWLYVSIFGGAKLRPWWVALNDGPGNATGPGEYRSKPCGHKFPRHCNSAFCNQKWCNVQRWPIFPWLFVVGHSFRIWCGPTYHRNLKGWKAGIDSLRRMKKIHPHGDTYSFISFR